MKSYKIQTAWKKRALIGIETYLKWYDESVKNPDRFWGKHGKRIDRFKPFTKVKNTSFEGKVAIKWYEDGLTNVSYNCIDRHLKKRGVQIAIIDGCHRDENDYYWITGRVDDVINVSGHRMGTAEVESALVSHDTVSEAAVVGYPHDLKGQGIYCYVTLMSGVEPSDKLRKKLVAHVRQEIGPIASPDKIQFAPGLPKTRFGKIMRRILCKIAEDDFDALGDTSTLADPAVADDLIENRQNKTR